MRRLCCIDAISGSRDIYVEHMSGEMSMWSTCLCGETATENRRQTDRLTDEHMNRHHGSQYKIDKSEDDNGSRAVFDDVDCFRSQG